jgi:mannosylglycerate hydrolase
MMPKERKTIHVVSNSHWDREWAYPFEETRLLLLDFMDNLLDLLDNNPDFHSFTMDSQTICLEDYLDFRPEKRETIKKHVQSGRLIIGPWYSLPEEYICNGESLVRNIVVGHRVADSFGKVSKNGYTPFSYGQTSQIPQIYNGFDINNIIFYRGINTPNCEYILEGPDGSRLLGSRFGVMSRFSYYIYVYRVLRYGGDDVFRRYDWDRGAAPFRLASDRHPGAHYYILDKDKKQWNDGPIRDQLVKLVEDESEHFSTNHYVVMQGFDSSDPDPKEMDIMKLCQKLLPEHDIKFSNLEDYMTEMGKEVKDPVVLTGEFRDPGSTGKWTFLYGDVISARPALKQANHKAEVNLQRQAEPWTAIRKMVGGEYLKPALDRAWKLLLQNHPHDTITGGGGDQMEKDALYRFDQINLICDGLVRRGLEQVQINIDNSDLDAKDAALTVYNACPFPRKGVISCLIDMPTNMGYEAFSVQSPDGKYVGKLQLKKQFEHGTLVRNLQDISIELRSDRAHCHVEVDEIPAFGYRTYHLVREHAFEYIPGSLVTATNTLENEYLKAEFNSDGTLDLTNKETGKAFNGIHYFEDTGESGHSWIHMTPDENQTLTSHGSPCSIKVEEDGPLSATMSVTYRMQIPGGLTKEMTNQTRDEVDNCTARSKEIKEMIITSTFTLRAGDRRLDVKTTFKNECKNHRLRIVFPTNLSCDQTWSEAGYDVIPRDIHVKKGNAYYGKPNPQYPMHRFVDMTDGDNGFAILNNSGIREYEAMDLADRPLAITLLRAFMFRHSPVFGRWEVYPDETLSQCLRDFEWSYSIYPHGGDWTNGVYAQAEDLNLPLEVAQVGPHKGTLPKSMGFMQVDGDLLQLTAFKRAEDRENSFIVRLFNPTETKVAGKLLLYKDVKKAWLTNLNEEREKEILPVGKEIPFVALKKKIVTIEFEL